MNPQNRQQSPEEQRRLLLAIALSAGILLVWNVIFPAAPPQQPAAPADGGAGEVAAPTGPAPTGQPGQAAAPPAAPAIADAPKRTAEIANDRHAVVVSNHDGQLDTWLLRESQYRVDAETPDGEAQPDRFVRPVEAGSDQSIFLAPLVELELAGQAAEGVYSDPKRDGETIVSSWTDPVSNVRVERRHTLAETPYGVVQKVVLRNDGAAPVAYDLRVRLRGLQNDDEAAGNIFTPPIFRFESLCETAEDFEKFGVPEIESAIEDDDPTRFTQGIRWAGVGNRYFMTATMGGEIEGCSLEIGRKAARIEGTELPRQMRAIVNLVDLPGGTIQPGETVERTIHLYGGPKLYEALTAYNPTLEEAVDFGWFHVICVPMLELMRVFHGWTANWGIAIILLTIFVKLLTFPLTHKQYKSMAGMKRIEPQLRAIQEKYKEDRMKLQQEMMALYKEHKINPLAGCFPVLLMMPIYFALYRTIYSAVELYHAGFAGWITDLSAADPYYVLPLLLGVVMFIQTRLNPVAGDQMQQKIMMNVMPIMFTFMMLLLPAGLVLYIFANTVMGIGQQYWLLKRPADNVGVPAKA